jgi:hypothetical protein
MMDAMIKSHDAPIFQGFSYKRLCVINMSHKPLVLTQRQATGGARGLAAAAAPNA